MHPDDLVTKPVQVEQVDRVGQRAACDHHLVTFALEVANQVREKIDVRGVREVEPDLHAAVPWPTRGAHSRRITVRSTCCGINRARTTSAGAAERS